MTSNEHHLEATVRPAMAFAIRSKFQGVLRMLCLCTVGLLSVASAWAQTPTAPVVAPSPGATCVVSAQNRTAPIDAQGNYVLYNLPGNGLIPFGVGGSAQPFRVRATCDDGTVGETPMAFPNFEQSVVNTGAIEWGKNTPVPSKLDLRFPSNTLTVGSSLQGSVEAVYPDGQSKNVTSRTTGTGYRSSQTFLGVVDERGSVSVGIWADSSPRLVITAENDGVVSSRVLKVTSGQRISGKVLLDSGQVAPSGILVQLATNYDFRHVIASTQTDAQGGYAFNELPVGMSYAALIAYQADTKKYGRIVTYAGNTAYDIQLNGVGVVRIKVLDAAGSPVAGVQTALQDAVRREAPDLALAQIVNTDANGLAVFPAVPAGEVTPLIGTSGAVATPTLGTLAANGVLEFKVHLSSGVLGTQASVAGSVTQSPDGSPAVGAVVRLTETTGLRQNFSKIVAADGKYRFDGLRANQSYGLEILSGNTTVYRAQMVQTGADGTTQTYDWTLPQSYRVLGTVFQTDGLAVAPDVTVQLSLFSFGTWLPVQTANTDAAGLYQLIVAGGGRYRLDAFDTSGAVGTEEFDFNAGTRVVQNIILGRLQTTTTVVAINARMMGLLPTGNSLAQVFVSNSRCATPCAVGALSAAIAKVVTDPLPGGLNRFNVVWKGRTQSFDVMVVGVSGTTQTTIERTVDFPPDVVGEIKVRHQNSWYTFSGAAGDSLQLLAAGWRTANSNPAYAVLMQVYGPDQTLVASGYGFDPASSNGVDLPIQAFALPATGTYTLVTSANFPTSTLALGSYGVLANLNDAGLALQPWAAQGKRFGGSVLGRVLRRDGSPAALQKVLISAQTSQPTLSLIEQVETLADGTYRYDNVPLGDVTVSVQDGDAVLASDTATLASLGQELTINLTMAKKTTLNVTMRVAADAPWSGNAQFTLSDAHSERTGLVVFGTGLRSAPTTVIAVGDTITLKATHPQNELIFAEKTISGSDGQTLNVELALVTGRVSGRTVNAANVAMPNVTVRAYRQKDAATGTYLTGVMTDGQGVFVFPALAAGQSIRLVAEDDVGIRSAAVDVTPIEGQTATAPDMQLDSGTLQGRVLFANGTPVGGVQVKGTTYTGRTLYADPTDAQGAYGFASAPAGQTLQISANHPVNGTGASVNVVVVGSTNTTAPDLVFAATAEVRGRVVRANGTGIEGATVVVFDFAGSACPVVPARQASLTGLRVTATTDASGNYVISGLPTNRGLFLSVNIANIGCLEQSKAVAALNGNERRLVPDFVFAQGVGSFHVKLVDAKGQQLDESFAGFEGNCGLRLSIFGSTGFIGSSYDGVRDFVNMVPDNYSATFEDVCGQFVFSSASVAVNDGDDKILPIVVPMVRGKVTLPSGRPNDYALVHVVGPIDGDVAPQYFHTYAKASGDFVIAAKLVPGVYLVTASIESPYVKKTVEVTISATPALVVQDLVLPGLGIVSGEVLTSSGATAGDGQVEYTNAEDPEWRGLGYITAGQIQNILVREGTNTIYMGAVDPAYLGVADDPVSYAQATAVVTRDGESIVLPPTRTLPFGTLELSTLNPEGTAAQGNQETSVRSVRVEPMYSMSSANKASNADGKVVFVLPEMSYQATVMLSPLSGDVVGGVDNVFISGGQTTLRSIARAGVSVNPYLYGTGEGPGTGRGVTLGGKGDFYITEAYGGGLIVNNIEMPALWPYQYGVQSGSEGRELLSAPYKLGETLQIRRKLYSPLVGGYIRLLDSFTNSGTSAVTVSVRNTVVNIDPGRVRVAANAKANNYIVLESDDGPGRVLMGAAYGDGVGTLKPKIGLFKTFNSESNLLTWTLTIPAGQTASLLTYYTFDYWGDLVVAQNKMTQIVGKTMVNMTYGLSPAEKASVKNFSIQP
jgi:hypothetical protein